jgi:putative aldouronate transport system permease protein
MEENMTVNTKHPETNNLKYSDRRKDLLKEVVKNKYIYIILIPGILFYAIFCYGPMYGIMLAFKEYHASKGILGSPFIGFKNFEYILKDFEFWQAFRNTLIISFGRIAFQFPVPIILALLINEMKEGKYRKFLQTTYTFPHFLSWVIISGIVINILGSEGAINNLLSVLGFEKKLFLAKKELFRPLLYITANWKGAGWSSIIYLASISSINPELYEAATIDGANRFQRMHHITWPGIKSTVVILLILNVGSIMNAGFDQVFNLYNGAVLSVSDIIDTYIYRITFQTGTDFGFSTAVGLFKSVINFLLLVSCDRIVKLMGEEGIFRR